MSALIRLFADICLFRRGPQHLPESRFLLGLTLATYGATSWILLGLETDWRIAALQVMVATTLLLGFVGATLASAAKSHRLTQTVTALVGSDTLFTVLAIACFLATAAAPAARSAAISLLTIWDILVIAHILRHALSQTYAVGLGLAVLYFIAVQNLLLLFLSTG